MRILVTGVKGQLGHDVMDELAAKGIEGIGVDVEEMDITDAAACEKVITEAKPDAVIHYYSSISYYTKVQMFYSNTFGSCLKLSLNSI